MQSKTFLPRVRETREERENPGSLPYLATAAAIGIVTLFQYQYLPAFAGYPFQFYFPVIALAALLFGTGVFAALLSGLAALFFFIPPHFSLAITSPGPVVGLVTFALASLVIILVVTLLRRVADHYFCAFERTELEKNREAAVMLDMHRRAASSFHDIAAGLTEHSWSADCEATKEHLQASARRLSAMGRLHDRLALTRNSAARINARNFLERLCDDLQASLPGSMPPHVEAMIQACEISHRQAIAVGHLISELIEEICRRSPVPGGLITVNFSCEQDGSCVLLVMHDGAGAASSATAIARRPIIATLVSQLRGKMAVEETAGAAWLVRFPYEQVSATA